MTKKAVLALGGNAIIKAGQQGTIAEQFKNTRDSLDGIVDLIKQGYHLAISHGNGPQVGNMLIQHNAGMAKSVSPLPLGVLVAATQGTMGYMIEQSLQNKLIKEMITNKVITINTQVVVSKDDPSMQNPTKPVGPFYTQAEARDLESEFGWRFVEDAGRGFRQVVPSPKPLEIIPASTIKQLVDDNQIVIACGGGGIPVVKQEDGTLEGVDAVIDKDFASALLAEKIGAEFLVILTGVDKVAINYGQPNQRELDELTVEQAEYYYAAGEFPKGSMGPKMLAAICFLKGGGSKVIITSIERVADAFAGKTGTVITR